MNNKALLLLSLGWCFAGCAGQTEDGAPGPLGPSGEPDCVTILASDICEYKGNRPVVEIDLDEKTVGPECIKAPKGGMLIFMIKSEKAVAKNSVAISPKEPENEWWPAGTNSKVWKQIQIPVPEKGKDPKKTFPAKEYEYAITAPDWCVDPRVEVIELK